MTLFGTHDGLAITFGILGNIISLCVFFAPLPTFFRIYGKKSTQGFQALPYLVGLFSSMLWLYYAMLKPDAFLLLTINSFGCFIQFIYISIFISYAPEKARNFTVKLFLSMNIGLFCLIFVLTHFLVGGALRITILGWICVALSVAVFAAPLSIMARVMRTKSVEFMPFSLSLCLTLSAIVWFAYGIRLKDICVALPNVLGFIFGLTQMGVYGIYKNGDGDGDEKGLEEKELAESIKATVTIGGASEVHPVDIEQCCNAKHINEEVKIATKVGDEANECSIDVSGGMRRIECRV